mmetsp:Transcript_73637/g.172782  ORF Transcript_73637/g.172782 Transcript_73637/m.172782 type:complete len:190 (-) Transcript_73637:760-1329(-)
MRSPVEDAKPNELLIGTTFLTVWLPDTSCAVRGAPRSFLGILRWCCGCEKLVGVHLYLPRQRIGALRQHETSEMVDLVHHMIAEVRKQLETGGVLDLPHQRIGGVRKHETGETVDLPRQRIGAERKHETGEMVDDSPLHESWPRARATCGSPSLQEPPACRSPWPSRWPHEDSHASTPALRSSRQAHRS